MQNFSGDDTPNPRNVLGRTPGNNFFEKRPPQPFTHIDATSVNTSKQAARKSKRLHTQLKREACATLRGSRTTMFTGNIPENTCRQ